MGESACWIDQVCMDCGRVGADLDEQQRCHDCRPRTDDHQTRSSDAPWEENTPSSQRG